MKHVGMCAELVPDSPIRNCALASAARLVELLEVAREDPLVVLLLQRRHGHAQDALVLGRQAALHILDDAPQQVRPQLRMQLAQLPGTQRAYRVSAECRVPGFRPHWAAACTQAAER